MKTIRNLQSNNDNLKQATTNGIKNFLLVDNYMISIDKINELLPELDKINKLHDAICFYVKIIFQKNVLPLNSKNWI